MKFQVLLSAMNQTDFSILDDSNLRCPTLIVNQTNVEKVDNFGESQMIFSLTRGLSKSRNIALLMCAGELCLLSDDDEYFVDDLQEKIVTAFSNQPDADIICFKISNYQKRLKNIKYKLKKFDLLKISSVQIAFRSSSVVGKVFFDDNLGAGTGNGAGEEVKFLLDAHKAGLKIYYCPIEIAMLRNSESSWFNKYDEKYFYNRGKVNRYIFGLVLGGAYSLYFQMFKYKLYCKDIGFFKSLKYTFKGLFARNINKEFV